MNPLNHASAADAVKTIRAVLEGEKETITKQKRIYCLMALHQLNLLEENIRLMIE
jgi:hypothetical protein